MQLKSQYLGLLPYDDAIHLLEEHFEVALQEQKGFIFGLEHPLVYTAGLRTEREHILQDNLTVKPTRRGGSVTLHNPGQLVVYFVIPLILTPGLETFVRRLEAAIIETLWLWGIPAFTKPPHSGAFTSRGKIAFVGLALKKQIIYHGIAINLNNNLNDYRAIHSCGLTLPVTRARDLTGETIPLPLFFEQLSTNIQKRFLHFSSQEYRRQLQEHLEQSAIPFAGFRLGQLFFNERRYWLAHEAWETAWHLYRQAYGKLSERDYILFLQGLTQAAMAAYKLAEEPNLAGAYSLLRKAKNKLENNSYTQTYLTNAGEILRWLTDTPVAIREQPMGGWRIPLLLFRLDEYGF